MIRRRRSTRTLAGVLAAAGVVVAGALGVSPAQATTEDDAFVAAVKQLGIQFAEGTDIPAVGRGACDSITAGATTGFRNPVTAVRGVVTTLENSGLTAGQSVGLVQYAVALYCPEFRAFMPR